MTGPTICPICGYPLIRIVYPNDCYVCMACDYTEPTAAAQPVPGRRKAEVPCHASVPPTADE